MIKGLVPKAVAIGVVVDFCGSILVGLVLGVTAAIIAGASGDPSPQHVQGLVANSYLKLVGLVGTAFFTGFGAYLAAKRSRPNGLTNALCVGVISLVLGITLAILKPGVTPMWKLVAGLVLTLPAAYAGGRFSEKGHEAV